MTPGRASGRTVFVTSSGTEIGKTLVAAAVVRQERDRGRAARALKPLMTGCGPGASGDAGILLEAGGEKAGAAAVTRISPWRFRDPLSPHLAAENEGRAVDFDALCAFCRREMAAARAAREALVIEGIGGAMVPVTRSRTVIDWIEALAVPAAVVVGSYLGALSHALTAAAALAGRGVRINAVVVSDSPSGVGLEATAATLEDFLPGTPVVRLPRLAGPEPWRRAPPLAAACLDGQTGDS